MTGLKLLFEKKNIERSFLLPFLPVIFFFLHNLNLFRELIFTPSVLLLFFIYSLFSFVIYKFFKLFFKLSAAQAAGIATIAIICFLFFGIFQDFLFHFKKYQFLSNTLFLLFILLALMGLTIFFTRKKQYIFSLFNRFILLLFLLLIFFEASLFCINMTSGKSFTAITKNMRVPIVINNKDSGQIRADIYHIIFDCYTNRPALKDYWKYENEIYPYLDSCGFYTADSSTSNYKTTPFSISSIFNLQYLKGVDEYLLSNSSNFLVGRKTYQNNILFNFLKQKGYNFSIFSQMDNEEFLTKFGFLGVEKQVNWLRKQTLERIYLNPWLIEKLTKYFRGTNQQPAIISKSMATFRDYNKKALEHILADCEKSSKLGNSPPVFNYTHFMLPHDPYQVDENGKLIPFAKPGGEDMNGYLKQVKYANKLIREITQKLLKDTSRKKIIIIQGDHGYRHYTNAAENEPYGALNAIYFYDKNYKGLYKKISLVNTYRVVINNFFLGEIPLLKDSIVGTKAKAIEN